MLDIKQQDFCEETPRRQTDTGDIRGYSERNSRRAVTIWTYYIVNMFPRIYTYLYQLFCTSSKKNPSHIYFAVYHIIITQTHTTQCIPEHISIIHKSHTTTHTIHIQTPTFACPTNSKFNN